MKILKLIVLTCCCLPGVAVRGAESGAADAEAAGPVEDHSRPSRATSNAERGEAFADQGAVLWFDASGARHWLAEQPARGGERGCVLLLGTAQASANGSGHLARLRHSLPGYGWHTYFLNAPDDGSTPALIAAARAQMRMVEPVVLVCEGATCLDLPQDSDESVAGSVFINVPLADGTSVDTVFIGRWQSLAAPGLILQEHPRGWPQTLALAADFELHLLPAGREGRENSRVLRKLRGWLKRRLQAG